MNINEQMIPGGSGRQSTGNNSIPVGSPVPGWRLACLHSGGRLGVEVLKASIEQADSLSKKQDLFQQPFISDPDFFKQYVSEAQRMIVGLGLESGEYKKLSTLLEHTGSVFEEQVQEYLVSLIAESRYGRARNLLRALDVRLESSAQNQLQQQISSVLHTERWNTREAVSDILFYSKLESWAALSMPEKHEVITLACSVEKIDMAHLLGAQLGMTDSEMRSALVPTFLLEGRPELAMAIAVHFQAPLRREEATRALQELQRQACSTGDAQTVSRIEILTDFIDAEGSLSIDRLPAYISEQAIEGVAPLVLVKFRGRTFAYVGSSVGGHPGAFEAFKEYLANEGFFGSPVILGGALVMGNEDSSLVIQGASSTYGACDRELAAKIIRTACPEVAVSVRNDFPEIRSNNN